MLKKQISAYVVNEPAQGARVCSLLRREGIELAAISAWGEGEGAVMRMVVSKPARAAALLRKRGYGVFLRVVVAVPVSGGSREIAEIFEKLGKKGVNVEYAYGSMADAEGCGLLVLGVENAPEVDLLFSE